ncbi:MAG TPA: hypothetical protein VHQ90_20875 [Thermoanaerobaculia bacterium]|nr:hypothetical protein [Thermoanaerobaculia bacterium]
MTTRELGAELGGIALLWLPGSGLLQFVPGLRRLSALRRQGYAYLLGTAAVGGSLFAASHLLAIPLRRPAIWGAALLPAAAGLGAALLRRRRGRDGGLRPAGSGGARAPRDGARRPAIGWRWLAWTAVAVACVGPLASALSAPLADWDGRMTWSAQAAYLRAEGTVDAEALRDARWYVVHPRYPPLLPLAQAAIQEAFGAGADEQLFRGAYVGFLAALLLVVYDGARRAAGAAAATATALAAALLPFLSYGPGGATSAYSDLPLAAFYGGALVLLLAGRPRAADGLAGGFLLAGAVLSKNEGLPLALLALLLGALRLRAGGRRRRRDRSSPRLRWLGAALLPAVLALALLASWSAGIPNREDEGYLSSLHAGALLSGAVSRLPVIAEGIWRSTFRWDYWHGFWAVAVIVLLVGWRGLRGALSRRMMIAAAGPPAIAWAAYAVTTHQLSGLVLETWSRFLEHATLPLLVLFAQALADVCERLRSGQKALRYGAGGLLEASIGSPPATPADPLPGCPEPPGPCPAAAGGEGDAPAPSRTNASAQPPEAGELTLS